MDCLGLQGADCFNLWHELPQQAKTFRFDYGIEVADTRDVAARAVETRYEAICHRIADQYKQWEWSVSWRSPPAPIAAEGNEDGHRALGEFRSCAGEAVVVPVGPAIFDRDVSPIDRTLLRQASTKRVH